MALRRKRSAALRSRLAVSRTVQVQSQILQLAESDRDDRTGSLYFGATGASRQTLLLPRYSDTLLPYSLFVELRVVTPIRKRFCDEVDKAAHGRRLAAPRGKDRMDDTG